MIRKGVGVRLTNSNAMQQLKASHSFEGCSADMIFLGGFMLNAP